MNAFARWAFPGTVDFDALEEAISDVVLMEEILLTAESVFLTPPCTDEAAWRDLNGYAATRTVWILCRHSVRAFTEV